MYILFHLFIGLLIGIVVARELKSNWAIPACAIASILPDLIDKPLGYYSIEYNSGRTISHTLLFFGIFVLIVFMLFLIQADYPVIFLAEAIALCVIIHQLLDSMWEDPVTWYYPHYGNFVILQYDYFGDYLSVMFWKEVTSPTEWLSGIGIVLITAILLLQRQQLKEGDIHAI
jgi:membrane-bound metal-dependent hydrolase YbcI (DUF457 family)